ncbi:MAG TPA: hypothetical protein DCY48_00375 [Candidatus Magasanikbacteria bacterium]|nr:MAG: hypothetical protein A3I74_02725 [Candidatus Magasanikbacteria bacterium RIFCSPLOWO2_02_FULL_47_16]OGH79591.1 MAG: hypothetical protein A3C10_00675 [Candidatus Magasanikbacteria bacterium RIFCSPHIGHO2_02_FULL_48_18]OGH82835.1 MAG: hypothetical protein A3G08_02880 [Candidatus Magasanikbacteria bacterium RIFCSPLOWO2_12_FULL_47_9b]HAZ28223.1 hypothetical protein [Candidatus Magasanikbacteria bacterium]
MALVLFTGCVFTIPGGSNTTTLPANNKPNIYQEIPTRLTSEEVNDFDPAKAVEKEIRRLRKKEYAFFHDQASPAIPRTPLYYLQSAVTCENDTKEACAITGARVYKNNKPEEYSIGACGEDDWCDVIDPSFPKDVAGRMTQLAGFYGFGKEIYTIGSISGNDEYTIFQNEKEIFSHPMYFGAESVIEEGAMVSGSPAFTFYDLKGWENENRPIVRRNIWHNGETLNERYGVDGSSYLFSFKEKIGFVAEKDEKTFFFFNGQKISEDFDEIRTHGCCTIFPYPISLDDSGILSFLARRQKSYFWVEINLN